MTMRFTISAIFFIVMILCLSIFVANLANIISTDKGLAHKLQKHSGERNEARNLENRQALALDDGSNQLMWFIQISDIHISIFNDPARAHNLKEFVTKVVDIVRPAVVLASGDLTDAREYKSIASRQFKKEWTTYKEILDDSGVANKTIWMDIRGNHDNFNVPGKHSIENYFTKYSVQGATHKGSYMKQIKVGSEKYSFIAVDACLEPGPKRPFNFFGIVDVNETSHIIDLADETQRSGSNYTIWFGHYPTATVLTPGAGSAGLRGIIGQYPESVAYLCGHLHTLGGIVPKMYTLQHAGFLELELGDWKDNRMFRVAAFDHGLFSFVDLKHNSWPIVLITNPKDALFNIPHKEDLRLQAESTHIRLLIFSDTEISDCKVQIDNEPWKDCISVTKNLYVTPWNAKLYNNGLHDITVVVRDERKSTIVHQKFSLDGTRLSFAILARFVLMGDWSKGFQALFGIALALCSLPLCIFRIWHELVRALKVKKPRIRFGFVRNMIRKFWILSSVDRVFIPLLVYCIYLAIGPWSFGEIVDGHMGVAFVWGLFVNNSYLPTPLTYLYGFFQLTFCQLPIIFIFANMLDFELQKIIGKGETNLKNKTIWKYFRHFPFFLIVLIETVLAYFYWQSYKTLAFLVGPLRTWSFLLHLIIWWMIRKIPGRCLRPAAAIWGQL